MSKFGFNSRTGQFEMQQRTRPSTNELFTQTKRAMYREIQRINMSDDELRNLVTKILGGTRNIMYLAKTPDERQRIDTVVRYINREAY